MWLFGHGTLEHIVSSNLSDWIVTGYTDIQHAFNLCMFLLGGYFVYLISSTIYPASRNLATFSYFTFPVLVGHAVFNYKDIFIATVYTGFTLNLIVARLSCHRNPCLHRLLSALITALMCSQKLVFFLPLALTHTIWELSCINYENLQPRKDFSAAVTRSIAYVLITVLFWYVLTPAAWLSPVSFIDQSLRLFTDFDQGGGCTYLLGHEFCLRENPSLAIKYILGWIFAHSPLHILLGYLACLAVTVGTLLGKKNIVKNKIFCNQLIYLVLQASLVLILVVLKGSNLYDADRHFLFIYPPAIILSSLGLLLLIERFKPSYRAWSIRLLSCYLLVLSLNIISLSPYQYIYFNEIVRPFVSHKNTSLDYWAASSREMVQDLVLHGWLPMKPSVRSHEQEQLIVEPPPLAYATRALGGEITTDSFSHQLFLEYRNPADFEKYAPIVGSQKGQCQVAQELSRSQIFFPSLLLSRSIVCVPIS